MRDFLAGTFGRFLQLVFSVAGLVLFVVGLVSCGSERAVLGGVLLLLSVLSWCAVFGVRYWLGHIMRVR